MFNETGHAINVANFEEVIGICQRTGDRYNPMNESLKLTEIAITFMNAKNALEFVTEQLTAFNIATNNRCTIFADLKPLATRLIAILKTTKASELTIENAKAINRKIQGTRSAKPTPINTQNPEANIETPKSISTSQQSYDQLVEHFARLISLLRAEPSYHPNEVEFKTATLNLRLNEMRAANTACTNAYLDLSNARIARNEVLYKKNVGLIFVAADIKQYLKGLFGATSPQFKQISGLKFTKP
jgi:hypothetical protein